MAQNEAASYINDRFGSKYSKHGSKVKNASGAQDAHEAIRPSSVFNTPESIAKYLDKKTNSSSIPLSGTVLWPAR